MTSARWRCRGADSERNTAQRPDIRGEVRRVPQERNVMNRTTMLVKGMLLAGVLAIAALMLSSAPALAAAGDEPWILSPEERSRIFFKSGLRLTPRATATPEQLALVRRGLTLVRLELVRIASAEPAGHPGLGDFVREQRHLVEQLEAVLTRAEPGTHHITFRIPTPPPELRR